MDVQVSDFITSSSFSSRENSFITSQNTVEDTPLLSEVTCRLLRDGALLVRLQRSQQKNNLELFLGYKVFQEFWKLLLFSIILQFK